MFYQLNRIIYMYLNPIKIKCSFNLRSVFLDSNEMFTFNQSIDQSFIQSMH